MSQNNEATKLEPVAWMPSDNKRLEFVGHEAKMLLAEAGTPADRYSVPLYAIPEDRVRLMSASPDFYKAADDLLQLFHGDDDVCPRYGDFLRTLRDPDREAVKAAIEALQQAIHKADGELA